MKIEDPKSLGLGIVSYKASYKNGLLVKLWINPQFKFLAGKIPTTI